MHAGLHKTGTTAIQAAFAGAPDLLRECNLLYPQAGRPADSGGHHNLAWQLARDRRFDAAQGTVDQAAAEIAAFDGDAILSSEDFESVLGSPERLRALTRHGALGGRDAILVIYVRDQAEYCESLFLEMMRHGMARDTGRFCDDVLSAGAFRFEDWVFHFDYDALCRRILRAGVARLVVRPYGALRGGSAVADLLHVAGQRTAAECLGVGRRANERDSLTRALTDFCALRAQRDPKGVEQRLGELLGGRLDGLTAHMSPARRRAFSRRFARGNRRLARACGFCASALDVSSEAPVGSIDMEQLFSARTAALVAGWLDGNIAADRTADFLQRLL